MFEEGKRGRKRVFADICVSRFPEKGASERGVEWGQPVRFCALGLPSLTQFGESLTVRSWVYLIKGIPLEGTAIVTVLLHFKSWEVYICNRGRKERSIVTSPQKRGQRKRSAKVRWGKRIKTIPLLEELVGALTLRVCVV